MKIGGNFKKRKGHCLVGDKVVPRGSNSFYWKLNKEYGLKVYYGLERSIFCSANCVKKVARRMNRWSKLGLSIEALKVFPVSINIRYDGEKIKGEAWAIKTRNMDMSKGGKAKERFKQKVCEKSEKYGLPYKKDESKDVNIGYDKQLKAYRLVDVA